MVAGAASNSEHHASIGSCLDLASQKVGRVAAFTCSLSADALCLLPLLCTSGYCGSPVTFPCLNHGEIKHLWTFLEQICAEKDSVSPLMKRARRGRTLRGYYHVNEKSTRQKTTVTSFKMPGNTPKQGHWVLYHGKKIRKLWGVPRSPGAQAGRPQRHFVEGGSFLGMHAARAPLV